MMCVRNKCRGKFHALIGRKYKRGLIFLLAQISLFCFFQAKHLAAQQFPLLSVQGNLDQGIMLPPDRVPMGRQDSAAMTQIRQFKLAVHAYAWTGMYAEGEMVHNANGKNGTTSAPEPTKLWILGHEGYRMDVQKADGWSSTRLRGFYGGTKGPKGNISPMDASNARKGLFAFPLLMAENFPNGSDSIIDQGLVSVDGVQLHLVTVGEFSAENTMGSQGRQRPESVTDLYFSPQSNLLIKSSTSVRFVRDPVKYLRVVEYGSYQEVKGVLIPFSYSLNLNGQPIWNLHLSTVDLGTSPSYDNFHF